MLRSSSVSAERQFGGKELFGFSDPLREKLVEIGKAGRSSVRKPQPHHYLAACRHLEPVMRGDFRAGQFRVHGRGPAGNQVLVEPVLRVRRPVVDAEEFPQVGFIFGEQKLRRSLRQQEMSAEVYVVSFQHPVAGQFEGWPNPAAFVFAAPNPSVPVPQRGQQMEGRGFWPTIRDGDLNENVVRASLGILGKDIEVSVVIKDAGI